MLKPSSTAGLATEPEPVASFYIGAVPVHGDAILAPMDGLSDRPYRSLCREMGSAMSITPFANAMELMAGSTHAWRTLDFLPEERPVAVQIYDSDEERLLQAALRAQDLGPDIIDINMGCSVRSVSGRGAGAGLLREPTKVGRIIASMARALRVPVTAKIRLGWDEHTRNYLDVARAIEENGGAAIAVHGRTRCQGYSGRADWEAIAAIKALVRIPVLGNGDVTCASDIDRLRSQTGCEAVLVGRAALGNPWIFGRVDRASVPPEALAAVLHTHLERMLAYYGPGPGLVLFRKHLARYLSPMHLPQAMRERILTPLDQEALVNALRDVGLPLPASDALLSPVAVTPTPQPR